MASQELQSKWENYTEYFEKYKQSYLDARFSGVHTEKWQEKVEKVLEAMTQLCEVAFLNEEEADFVWGK